MSAFLTLFAAYWLFDFAFVLITWALAACFGVVVKEIVIGSGPTLFKGYRVTLKPILLGSSLKFASTEEGDPTRGSFDTRSDLVRLTINLVPWIVLGGVGALLVPSGAKQSFIETYPQLFFIGILPFTKGQMLIASALEFARLRPFSELLGMTALKLTALNLLPLIPSAGFMSVRTILVWCFGSGAWENRLTTILFWPYLVFWCLWIVAFGTYVAQNAS